MGSSSIIRCLFLLLYIIAKLFLLAAFDQGKDGGYQNHGVGYRAHIVADGGVEHGVEYDADGVKLNEFYEEGDDYGVVLIRSHDYTDGSDYEYRVERNDRGHMIYSYNSDAENKEIYYGYTYDSKGNWTRKVEYHGVIRKPVEIVEREITY